MIQSTAWVKRESEKRTGQSTAGLTVYPHGDVSACFTVDEGANLARYSTSCAESKAKVFAQELGSASHQEL